MKSVLLAACVLLAAVAEGQITDVTQTGQLTAAALSPALCVYPPNPSASCVKLNYEGRQSVAGTLTGSFAALLIGEISGDGGTTWTQVSLGRIQSFQNETPTAAVDSPGVYSFLTTHGGQLAQMRVTTYNGGTVGVMLRATQAR